MSSTSKLRVVHTVAGGPEVDIYTDGAKVASKVPYGKISNYLTLTSGLHVIQILVCGSTKALVSGSVDLLPGTDYTAIVHGSVFMSSRPLTISIFVDDNSCPPPGKATIRFIHASAEAPAVDAYFNEFKTFADVKYGSTSNPTYLPVDIGEYSLVLRLKGKKDKVFGPTDILLDHKTYTFIASGYPGTLSHPLVILNSIDNEGYCM